MATTQLHSQLWLLLQAYYDLTTWCYRWLLLACLLLVMAPNNDMMIIGPLLLTMTMNQL